MNIKNFLKGITAMAVLSLGLLLQTVNAQPTPNVAGFYRITIPAGGTVAIANQLINGSDTYHTNNDINVCLTNGVVSDPIGTPNGSNTVYLYWTGASFASYFYLNAADATTYNGEASPAGWYDTTGTLQSVFQNQWKGAFLKNKFSQPITIIITGMVQQGTNSTTINTGDNFTSLSIPSTTTNLNPNIGLPSTLLNSDPNGPPNGTNDICEHWLVSFYTNSYFFNTADESTFRGHHLPGRAGFYDTNHVVVVTTPSVGEAFFLKHFGNPITRTSIYNLDWNGSNATIMAFRYYPTNIAGTNYIGNQIVFTNLVSNHRYGVYGTYDTLVVGSTIFNPWLPFVIFTNGASSTSYTVTINIPPSLSNRNIFWRAIKL